MVWSQYIGFPCTCVNLTIVKHCWLKSWSFYDVVHPNVLVEDYCSICLFEKLVSSYGPIHKLWNLFPPGLHRLTLQHYYYELVPFVLVSRSEAGSSSRCDPRFAANEPGHPQQLVRILPNICSLLFFVVFQCFLLARRQHLLAIVFIIFFMRVDYRFALVFRCTWDTFENWFLHIGVC